MPKEITGSIIAENKTINDAITPKNPSFFHPFFYFIIA